MKRYVILTVYIALSIVLCGAKKEYTGPPVERRWFKFFDTFGEKVAKKNQLQSLMTGFSDVVEEEDDDILAIAFVDRRNLTIEQARPMIVSIVDEFWTMMSESKLLEDFRLHVANLFKKKYVPFDINLMGIKVSFWNENIDRPLSPYLAQIKVVKGQVLYFYADPKTQALQKPIIENLEEARNLTQKDHQPKVIH